MPERSSIEDVHKYDHSDHPTTHRKAGDLAPESNAKQEETIRHGIERFPGGSQAR